MPENASTLRIHGTTAASKLDVEATLIATGEDAAPTYHAHVHLPGAHLLLGGDSDYYVVLTRRPAHSDTEARKHIKATRGHYVLAQFPGRSAVRRKVIGVSITDGSIAAEAPEPVAPSPAPAQPAPISPTPAVALDLTSGIRGAAPL